MGRCAQRGSAPSDVARTTGRCAPQKVHVSGHSPLNSPDFRGALRPKSPKFQEIRSKFEFQMSSGRIWEAQRYAPERSRCAHGAHHAPPLRERSTERAPSGDFPGSAQHFSERTMRRSAQHGALPGAPRTRRTVRTMHGALRGSAPWSAHPDRLRAAGALHGALPPYWSALPLPLPERAHDHVARSLAGCAQRGLTTLPCLPPPGNPCKVGRFLH